MRKQLRNALLILFMICGATFAFSDLGSKYSNQGNPAVNDSNYGVWAGGNEIVLKYTAGEGEDVMIFLRNARTEYLHNGHLISASGLDHSFRIWVPANIREKFGSFNKQHGANIQLDIEGHSFLANDLNVQVNYIGMTRSDPFTYGVFSGNMVFGGEDQMEDDDYYDDDEDRNHNWRRKGHPGRKHGWRSKHRRGGYNPGGVPSGALNGRSFQISGNFCVITPPPITRGQLIAGQNNPGTNAGQYGIWSNAQQLISQLYYVPPASSGNSTGGAAGGLTHGSANSASGNSSSGGSAAGGLTHGSANSIRPIESTNTNTQSQPINKIVTLQPAAIRRVNSNLYQIIAANQEISITINYGKNLASDMGNLTHLQGASMVADYQGLRFIANRSVAGSSCNVNINYIGAGSDNYMYGVFTATLKHENLTLQLNGNFKVPNVL